MTTPYLYVPVFSWPAAPGGKLHTYLAGGTVAQATYSDAAGVTPNTNPVTLDSLGSAVVRLAVGVAYHFVLKDATDTTTLWDADNYDNNYLSTGAGVGAVLYPQTTAEIAAGVTPANLAYPPLNPYRYGADGAGGAADIAAFTAVNNVLAQITGLNWFKNDLRSLPNDVRRYGAVGDGVTDDSAAFARALTQWSGKAIIVPTPPVAYKITAAGLTVPANTAVIGDNKRTCKFLAGGNIDVFTLNDGAQLYRLYVEGNATTGHGMVFPSGAGNQTLMNCRVINFAPGVNGGCLHFADNTAGSRFALHDVETWQTGVSNGTPAVTGTGLYAIYVPDVFNASAVPRKFAQLETSGAPSFFLGGCNDLFIGESFLADIAWSTNSRAVQLSGSNRIANQVSMVIKGANHSFGANDVLPQLILDSSLSNSVIGPQSLDGGQTVFYSISGITQAASAVVTISTVSGTNPIKVGQYVTFDNVLGMTQINGLNGPVTAIGGISGAWTITVTINSSAFTAYTSGGNLSAPVIIDNTLANNSVQVYSFRQIYNPMGSAGGGGFVLGNGTLSGYFSRIGSATFVVINFTLGTTTNLGAGALQFTLPVAKQDGEVICGGSAILNRGGTLYSAQTQIPGNVNYVTLIRDTSGSVTFNSPAVFASGDTMRLSFTYEP